MKTLCKPWGTWPPNPSWYFFDCLLYVFVSWTPHWQHQLWWKSDYSTHHGLGLLASKSTSWEKLQEEYEKDRTRPLLEVNTSQHYFLFFSALYASGGKSRCSFSWTHHPREHGPFIHIPSNFQHTVFCYRLHWTFRKRVCCRLRLQQ